MDFAGSILPTAGLSGSAKNFLEAMAISRCYIVEVGMEQRKPEPARLEALRNLPREVMQSLTKEEIRAFLHSSEWPDSLKEKLKGYMEDLE